MVQEFLSLLPRLGTAALIAAAVGALSGAGLWLIGARFSRSLITLVLVFVGASVGLQMPRWFGWPIDGWSPALGMATLLGISGFLLHRFWVGIGLGLVWAMWAGLVTWALCHDGKPWAWPDWRDGTGLHAYLYTLWVMLPIEVCRVLPFVCGAALISGITAALLWPRAGIALLYSTAGVSLLVGLGLVAIRWGEPQWKQLLPARTSSQALALLGMVAFGALLQWRFTPAITNKAPATKKKSPSTSKGKPIAIGD